jgi:hypothetical protein
MRMFLEDALCAAVDATVATQKYAASQGLTVKFDDPTLQDLASTAGINYTRENENRMRYPGHFNYAQPRPNGTAVQRS